MLPFENRLKLIKDFDRVFKNSRPVFGGNLSVRAMKRKGENMASRYGFIISNKIDKRATRRNALRRQLREIVQALLFELKSGYDVVVIVKQNFQTPYDQGEIKKQVADLFLKAGLK